MFENNFGYEVEVNINVQGGNNEVVYQNNYNGENNNPAGIVYDRVGQDDKSVYDPNKKSNKKHAENLAKKMQHNSERAKYIYIALIVGEVFAAILIGLGFAGLYKSMSVLG